MGTIHRAAIAVLLVASTGCGAGLSTGEDAGPGSSAETTAQAGTTVPAQTTAAGQATDPTQTTAPASSIAPNDLELAGVDFGVLDLPKGEPYEEYVLLTDDTDIVEMEVPKAWSQVESAPQRLEGAGGTDEPFPHLGAAIDMKGFEQGWTEGALLVNDPTADTEQSELDLLTERTFAERDCKKLHRWRYDDGSYTGLAQMWTGCGPSGAAHLAISAFINGDHLLVVVQLRTDADIDAAKRVIETFAWVA